MTYRKSVVAALLAFVAIPAAGQAPPMLTYSGYLLRADGSKETAPGTLSFRIYSASSGGEALWTENVLVAPAEDGWFAAVLGITEPFAGVDWESDLWLGIAFGAEPEMAPRLRLTAAARSLSASWSRLTSIPAPCGAGQFLRGYTALGAPVCADEASPSAYAAGDGLTLTGGTFSIASGGCVAGQVLKWGGTSWSCQADLDTAYSAGSGLSITGTTISLNSAGCAPGQLLKWNGSAWSCQADLDTTYTAGSGLSLTGATLSASFGGTGSASTVARSDHAHSGYVPYTAGNASVSGAYGYTSAKVGYLAFSALAFGGEGLVQHVGFGETYLRTGVTQAWSAVAVHLPNGATITEFRCTVLDNDAGYFNASLRRNQAYPNDAELASVTTNGLPNNASAQNLSDTSIANPTVDNGNWNYYISAFLTGSQNTRDLSFNGCRVTYTVTTVAP